MLDPLDQGDPADWNEMLDTNVKGLLHLCRAVVPGMRERNRGHIVNLGSLAGRQIYPGGAVYCASKAAVRAISEGLKQDLLGSAVRVTEIAPGMVDTEFSTVRFHGDASRAEQVYRGLDPLSGGDVAEVVLFALSRPAHVNISEVLLMPVAQAGSTMVHREATERG
jgi:NADP-dependent 3-hydroxy acid dehydrogenase YdfG